MSAELRTFIVRTAAGAVVSVACEGIKVTSRGDLLGVVGGFDTNDDTRALHLRAPERRVDERERRRLLRHAPDAHPSAKDPLTGPTKFSIHNCAHPLCVNPNHVHARPSPLQRVINALDPAERAVYCAQSAIAGLDALNPEICGLSMGVAMGSAGRVGSAEGRAVLAKLERADAMLRAGQNAAARHTLQAILREHDRLLAGIHDRLGDAHIVKGMAA